MSRVMPVCAAGGTSVSMFEKIIPPESAAPPMPGQVFAKVIAIDDYQNEHYREVEFRPTIDDANVTTSKVFAKDSIHKLIIDIDMPAQLIPSTTPGHFHLYVDHEMPWHDYVKLLEVLAAVGIIERGYLGASQARGYTSVRLPWVKKESANQPMIESVIKSSNPEPF